MLRFLLYVAIAVGLVYLATNVQLGKRSFVGHVRAIWQTDEVKELKDGVKEKASPAVDRLERGVKEGYRAASREDGSEAKTDVKVEAKP